MRGLTVPDADTLRLFCDSQENAYLGSGGIRNSPGDPANQSVCVLKQLPPKVDCSASGNPGWCYVEGGNSGCAQAIVFSNGSPPPGSLTTLACIETSVSVVGDGGP
jgi:hypothetical protein